MLIASPTSPGHGEHQTTHAKTLMFHDVILRDHCVIRIQNSNMALCMQGQQNLPQRVQRPLQRSQQARLARMRRKRCVQHSPTAGPHRGRHAPPLDEQLRSPGQHPEQRLRCRGVRVCGVPETSKPFRGNCVLDWLVRWW